MVNLALTYRLAFFTFMTSTLRQGASGARCEERIMGWIAWIILGLIAGFIASKLVNRTGSGILLDIVIGIIGAVVGGYIGNALGVGGINGLTLWSIVLSVLGAVIVLWLYSMVAGRRV
jgi:uncharacterized membrane protein YeaQ/YmgE (transglycosylase-associated protein family)